MTAAQATEIVRLYERGMRVRDIATWFRCHESMVFKARRFKGVQARCRRRWWQIYVGDPDAIIRELRAAR